MYELALSPQAKRVFETAQTPLQRKLGRGFAMLRLDPRHYPQIKALTGPLRGYWRFRTGDFRIIYRIDDPRQTVWVDRIAHRSEVYE